MIFRDRERNTVFGLYIQKLIVSLFNTIHIAIEEVTECNSLCYGLVKAAKEEEMKSYEVRRSKYVYNTNIANRDKPQHRCEFPTGAAVQRRLFSPGP